jgi:hypothetical protein
MAREAEYELKERFKDSITVIYKRYLESLELLIASLEGVDSMYLSDGQERPDFEHFNNLYRMARKHVLDAGNDEIRQFERYVDTLKVEERPKVYFGINKRDL